MESIAVGGLVVSGDELFLLQALTKKQLLAALLKMKKDNAGLRVDLEKVIKINKELGEMLTRVKDRFSVEVGK